VRLRGPFLLSLCAALAGCGGATQSSDQVGSIRPAAQVNHHCSGSKIAARRQAQRKRLDADLRQLRVATATLKSYTQNGNAAVNTALDRFQLDVATEALSVHERSRYIDRAAAIVAPRCYLCFQALESSRPIAAGAKLACG
jgi:hypothetical protein